MRVAVVSWIALAFFVGCSGVSIVKGGPQHAESLGGGGCTFGRDRTELKWEIMSDRDSPEARFWVDGVNLDGAGVEVQQVDGAPVPAEGKKVALSAFVPYRFTLTLGALPHSSGRLAVDLLLSQGGEVRERVRDSWCEVTESAAP
jgi:hypothetical protein